jgi:organic hydroperoxide reductase OsmC/OhrA
VADKRHTYSIRVDWTGNQGTGTSAYRAYSRAHEISAQGKTAIAGSSDPVFRGDAARWNPAELLIAALSACHQLWYLHLCADAGIVVLAYSDDASGVEIEQADGAGQFESVTLRPHAKLGARSDESIARRLHDAAAEKMLYRSLGVVQGRAQTDLPDCVGVGEPLQPPLADAVSTEAENPRYQAKIDHCK